MRILQSRVDKANEKRLEITEAALGKMNLLFAAI